MVVAAKRPVDHSLDRSLFVPAKELTAEVAEAAEAKTGKGEDRPTRQRLFRYLGDLCTANVLVLLVLRRFSSGDVLAIRQVAD